MEDQNTNAVPMARYIGTKIIHAEPMTNAIWESINHKEDDTATTMSTEDVKEGYMVEYEDGYRSWSPKDAFEKAYRLCEGMNFGLALEALKKGYSVAREGWNGKNMFLYLNRGSVADMREGGEDVTYYDGVNGTLFEHGAEGTITRLPNINMRAASGNTVTGWLASQTDMLADDWVMIGMTGPGDPPA